MDKSCLCFVVFGGVFRFFVFVNTARNKFSLCSRTKRAFSVLSTELRWRCFAHCARARTHMRNAREQPTTNDATCGPPAWLAGSLHEGRIRSVRSPLRRGPLLATLIIATPLQGGRPENPAFCSHAQRAYLAKTQPFVRTRSVHI